MKLKNALYIAAIMLAFAIGVMAQDKTPKPTEAPKPAYLTRPQIEQLSAAEVRLAEARAQVEKLQAQIQALVAEFRWQLGISPATHQPGLQILDQQSGAVGFAPLPPPTKPEDKK